ncbi:MAG TPA: SIMPL domain-containing protein, partial [Bradyrhizobium sp.]
MKHLTVFAAAIAAGTLLVAPVLADTEPPAVISVTGEATVSVAPDLAQIDGGVTSDAKTAREASDANNAAMGKVLLALKGAGIAEKDLQTSRLSLQPESAPNRSPPSPPIIVGYRASNHVTVRLRDVTKVANVIDTMVAAGANDIGGINFSVSNASKLLDDARE